MELNEGVDRRREVALAVDKSFLTDAKTSDVNTLPRSAEHFRASGRMGENLRELQTDDILDSIKYLQNRIYKVGQVTFAISVHVRVLCF